MTSQLAEDRGKKITIYSHKMYHHSTGQNDGIIFSMSEGRSYHVSPLDTPPFQSHLATGELNSFYVRTETWIYQHLHHVHVAALAIRMKRNAHTFIVDHTFYALNSSSFP